MYVFLEKGVKVNLVITNQQTKIHMQLKEKIPRRNKKDQKTKKKNLRGTQ